MNQNENHYCVYVHIAPNGKLYIGLTGQKPQDRWQCNGLGYRKQFYFYSAIQKYGWDNFQHIVIIEGVSKNMASECEKALIEKYHSNDQKYGYNLTQGGDGGMLGYRFTDEQRRKVSEALKGRKRTEEQKQHISEARRKCKPQYRLSDEGREKIRESVRQRSLGNTYRQGKKMSEESRQKMREAHLGKHLSEENRKRFIELGKQALNDPVKREQRIAKLKAAWVKRKQRVS